MKSLTGSKKVIEMLNRLGYSVSYNVVEEIETELTFEATKQNHFTPDGMLLNPDLATGVVCDTFDRFVETLSGKDTLHDTVGIVYQSTRSSYCSRGKDTGKTVEIDQSSIFDSGKKVQHKKRRRTFEVAGLDIEPYRKKKQKCPIVPFFLLIIQKDWQQQISATKQEPTILCGWCIFVFHQLTLQCG